MSTGESILLPCIYSLFSALSLHYSMHTRVEAQQRKQIRPQNANIHFSSGAADELALALQF